MGQELAYSRAFAECQTEKVFRKVCFRWAHRRRAIVQPGHLRRPSTITSRPVPASLRGVFAQVAARVCGPVRRGDPMSINSIKKQMRAHLSIGTRLVRFAAVAMLGVLGARRLRRRL